jgi:cytochrome oxidase Cu insertion factor (SCO1/SenC/PrrC family)
MAEENPNPASSKTPGPAGSRRRSISRSWALAAAAALAGIGAGAGLALTQGRSATPNGVQAVGQANVVWPAAKRRAPNFALHDQAGTPISLHGSRGRVVILTFIDPLCTTLCPLEAKVLDQVEQRFPPTQRPEVIAVSVNPWGNARRYLREDARKWRLDGSWRWAIGSRTQLTHVWQAYAIGVRITRRVTAGITVHQVDHTEAAYLIDRRGYERALFIYPFAASDVERTVRRLESGPA